MVKTDTAYVSFFDGPSIFGLDELHLIGMCLCQTLFKLLGGFFDVAGFDKGPFSLEPDWKDQLTKDFDKSRTKINLDDFEGSFDIPWSKYTTQAVDWIDVVRYAVPALVVPSLANAEAANALMSMVRFVQRTQCRQLDDFDLEEMDSDLLVWNTYLQQMFNESRINKRFLTPNHHYLNHVTRSIRHLGPMCSYSTRSMERSIGNPKRLIRSNKDSGMNAMNVMVGMAALAYIDQRRGVDSGLNMDDGCNWDTRLGKTRITQLTGNSDEWPEELRKVASIQGFYLTPAPLSTIPTVQCVKVEN